MNGRCNLSQLNALFAEGKTHTPWAQNWDHTFGSWAANFSIVAPFLGPESGPCFGATKHKQELVNAGSKCATADASWQQHISVILWNQHPGTKRKKTWMEDATCRSSTRSLQKAKRIHHGPKIGTTHLEAGLLILVLWPHFWVQNLAPVLGPPQTGASQCGQQVCYCRRKLTAAHIRDTVKPASWHQAQENMNGRCNLSQLNALFAEGKTHTPWAQNWDHTFGSWAANFSIVAPFLGPESGPCLGPQNTNRS